MKAKEIQELIDFIAKSGLNKVNIETEEFKISVKRDPDQKVKYVKDSGAAPAPAAAPAASDDSRYVAIKAPMIGTFYRAASPESPIFVNVGDEVKKGQIICIIEAMKLFNEIESEISGKIVKVLVDNANPVEYDQPLFLVDPS